MASPKKQEKGGKIADAAASAPLDSSVTPPSSEGGSVTTPSVAITAVPDGAADPQGNTAPQAPNVAAPPSAGPVLDMGVNVDVSGNTQTTLANNTADSPPSGEKDASGAIELNPSRIEVYPLRSFMDDGELRRRGGPSYQVLRQHAEELEQRGLVSREPLRD